MLHGCVPVVVMDDVDPVFSSILDWDAFSIRIAEVAPPDRKPPFLTNLQTLNPSLLTTSRISAVLHGSATCDGPGKTCFSSRFVHPEGMLLQPCHHRYALFTCSAALGHEDRPSIQISADVLVPINNVSERAVDSDVGGHRAAATDPSGSVERSAAGHAARSEERVAALHVELAAHLQPHRARCVRAERCARKCIGDVSWGRLR